MTRNKKKKHDHKSFKASFKKNKQYIFIALSVLLTIFLNLSYVEIHTNHYTAEFYTVILICINMYGVVCVCVCVSVCVRVCVCVRERERERERDHLHCEILFILSVNYGR